MNGCGHRRGIVVNIGWRYARDVAIDIYMYLVEGLSGGG
jgi:hypothetical protein